MAVQKTTDPSLALMAAGAPEAVDTKIKEINVNGAKQQEAAFEEFKKGAEDLKNSKSNGESQESDWRAELEKKRDAMKKRSEAAIDASFNAAAKYISDLPKEQQKNAYNVFETGANIVAKVAELAFAKIKEVIGAVADFLRGVWDKVTTTFNSVKSFVTTAIGSIVGRPSALGALQPIAGNNGLYEGSVTWKASVPLGQAAIQMETTCGLLDHLLAEVQGPKPEFTFISSSIQRSQEKTTASILFKTTKNAEPLGQHFKAVFGRLVDVVAVDWTPRGGSSLPTIDGEKKNVDCSFTLRWAKRNQFVKQDIIQETLNYLQATVASATSSKYIVYTAPVEETKNSWESEILCRSVPNQDEAGVFEVMQNVLSTELGRKTPVASHPHVPTPDVFTFEEFKA
ncbi:MAG: hypothetical protein LQ351_007557 [Letrouitia transgressa]|nr:MAG: hypothetical protein LQ351_007557 [Letrouitia transgressa]